MTGYFLSKVHQIYGLEAVVDNDEICVIDRNTNKVIIQEGTEASIAHILTLCNDYMIERITKDWRL